MVDFADISPGFYFQKKEISKQNSGKLKLKENLTLGWISIGILWSIE